jgi:hypothetical protein
MVDSRNRETGSRNDLPIDLTADVDAEAARPRADLQYLLSERPRPRPKEQRTREKPSWLSQEGIEIVTLEDDDPPPSQVLPQEKSKPREHPSPSKADIDSEPNVASLLSASLIGEGPHITSSTRAVDGTTTAVRDAGHHNNCENERRMFATTSERSTPMDPKRISPIVPNFGPLASNAKDSKHEQRAKPALNQAIRKSAPSVRGPMFGAKGPFRPFAGSLRMEYKTANRTELDQKSERVESLRKTSPAKKVTQESPANLTQRDVEAEERRSMPAPERVRESHGSTGTRGEFQGPSIPSCQWHIERQMLFWPSEEFLRGSIVTQCTFHLRNFIFWFSLEYYTCLGLFVEEQSANTNIRSDSELIYGECPAKPHG